MADPITDPANPNPPIPPVVPPVTPPVTPPTAPVDQPLGEAGMRALEREREAAAEARREAAAAKAELDAFRLTQMTDQEKALEAAKAEGAAEVSAKFAQQVLLSEIRVAAAGKLNDPADAVRLLDLSKFKVADDGTVDTTAITSAIDDLVKNKPYLAAGKAPTPPVDTGQGARPVNSALPQIRDRAALEGMTPEQIVAAHKAGQFADMQKGI